jgi:hypothetical protein
MKETAVRATGYLMDADLTDGVLTIEGRGRMAKFGLDWELADRHKAESRGEITHDEAKGHPPLSVHVSELDDVTFHDANPLVNGHITIHSRGRKAMFHFRRKTRDEARVLYEEIQRERGVPEDALHGPSADEQHLSRHERKEAEKQRKADAAAHVSYTAELREWQALRDGCAERLEIAKTADGSPDADGLLLKKGELVFAIISGAALVEDRRGAGEWKGRSQGVSFPIAKIGGRSVRYRVGQTRGHYVQGAPVPTAIDTGDVVVTNQRVIFKGAKQSRECLYTKLLAYEASDDGTMTLSVSNRQKATVVYYGEAAAGEAAFRLDLALAHFREDVPALVEQIEADLQAIDDAKPEPPDAESGGEQA